MKNLGAVFQCLKKASLKLSTATCLFRLQELFFLYRTITTKKSSPIETKDRQISMGSQISKIQKTFQRYIWLLS